jgi:hypothetical protein
LLEENRRQQDNIHAENKQLKQRIAALEEKVAETDTLKSQLA